MPTACQGIERITLTRGKPAVMQIEFDLQEKQKKAGGKPGKPQQISADEFVPIFTRAPGAFEATSTASKAAPLIFSFLPYSYRVRYLAVIGSTRVRYRPRRMYGLTRLLRVVTLSTRALEL